MDHIDREYLSVVAARLKSQDEATEKNGYIYNIKCLSCGELTAYAKSSDPRKIWCNRKAKCGAEHTHAEHFPGLQKEVYSLHKSADYKERGLAYAHIRRGIKTFEEQGGKVVYKRIFDESVIALAFKLTKGDGKEATNFRLINHSNPKKTSCTWGGSADALWIPETEIDFDKPLAIAEAPIKAMALNEAGIQAIAVVSSSCRPDSKAWLSEKLNELVAVYLAFDNDTAGELATKIWKDFFDKEDIPCEVYFPIPGEDWDDMHKKGNLSPKIFEDCSKYGKIFLSESPLDAALIMQESNMLTPVFEYKGSTYKCKYDKLGELSDAIQILRGTLRASHSFFKDEFSDQREYEYHLVFQSSDKRMGSERIIATGKDLSSDVALDALMLKRVRTNFKGSRRDISLLLECIVKPKKTPSIRYYDRYGYHPESKAYIFANYAVTQAGQILELNEHKYYDGLNVAPMKIKDMSKSKHMSTRKSCNPRQLLQAIYDAWGIRGLLTVAYYLATLFSSSTIFKAFGFFPHLSLFGPKNTGKTGLTKVCNRIFLLEDREGYPLTKKSTSKSYARILSSKDSLPVVLLEGNKGEKVPIDENDLLTAYNREALQTRANFTQDNTINELQYDAGLVMVQNDEWFQQGAVKERFISIKFEDTGGVFTSKQHLAYKALNNSKEQCVDFGLRILRDRKFFEDNLITHIEKASEDLLEGGELANDRLRNNHAIAYGSLTCLLQYLEIPIDHFGDLHSFVKDIAIKRMQNTSNTSDNVTHFFNAFEELAIKKGETGFTQLQKGIHYIVKSDEICIRLTEALRVLDACGYRSVTQKELASELRLNEYFVKDCKVKSVLWQKDDRPRVFVFKVAVTPSLKNEHLTIVE